MPGMVAALTPLPVIGVPVKSSMMNGLDSLYSIVQMPRGIPVATVAIGNAMNAGLLAIRMLAIGEPQLRVKMNEVSSPTTKQIRNLIQLHWRVTISVLFVFQWMVKQEATVLKKAEAMEEALTFTETSTAEASQEQLAAFTAKLTS